MKLNALYPVLGTEKLPESRDFYVGLLDLRVSFENDWYVSLATRTEPVQQIAFVDHDHEAVPAADRKLPSGVLVTLEVDDLAPIWDRARAQHEIVLALRDEPWGQRHFIVRDPNGVLVDVVQVIPPSEEYASAYATS
jgi:catechol 2,3-dioxygenase-like lactoylglutathione lyase family enzyme